ncbi:unnamed protein product [Dicrocoelium dendriticum]|nr:unnamed protein product [Dicrocoelium dendriticum]
MVKLFVGNLNPQSKASDLRKKFEAFGTVTECDVVNNYGFVHMEKESEAEAALAGLQDAILDGVKINVERSHGKRSGGPGPMRRREGRFRDGPADRFRGPPPRYMGAGPPPRMGRYGPGFDDGYGGPYGPPPPRVSPRGYDYPPNGTPGRYPPPERGDPARPPPRAIVDHQFLNLSLRQEITLLRVHHLVQGTMVMTVTENTIVTESQPHKQPRDLMTTTIITGITAVVRLTRKVIGLRLLVMSLGTTTATMITVMVIALLFQLGITTAVHNIKAVVQRWHHRTCHLACAALHLCPRNSYSLLLAFLRRRVGSRFRYSVRQFALSRRFAETARRLSRRSLSSFLNM